MNKAKKFSALVLLLLAFTVMSCGNDKEQNTAADRAESGASDTIGAGADMGAEAGAGDAESDGAENPEGERVLGNKDIYIYLTDLEMDDEEGTAYLHIINRTEDRTISIAMDEVKIDGRDSEWQTDEEATALAAGETKDMAVRFSRPDYGDDTKKLSECSYIRFEAAAPGLYGKENAHVGFYVKGDEETAEAVDEAVKAELNRKPSVEKQELYNDSGIIITLTEMRAVKGSVTSEGISIKDSIALAVDFTNNLDRNVGVPICYEVYIGDMLIYNQTLISEQKNVAEVSNIGEGANPGETVQRWVDISGEGLYDQLLEEMEISIIFKVHNPDSSQADELGYILSPKVTIPVVLK